MIAVKGRAQHGKENANTRTIVNFKDHHLKWTVIYVRFSINSLCLTQLYLSLFYYHVNVKMYAPAS